MIKKLGVGLAACGVIALCAVMSFGQQGIADGRNYYDYTTSVLDGPTVQNPVITGGTSTAKAPVRVMTSNAAVTVAGGLVVFSKTSAIAATLAAPTVAQDGMEIILTAGTAFAHVLTATSLIEDGVTGGAKTTATFAAFVGATITLRAYNLKWHVVSKNVVTIT